MEGGSEGGGEKKKKTEGPAVAPASALPVSVCAGLAFVSEFARRAATADPEICIGALEACVTACRLCRL